MNVGAALASVVGVVAYAVRIWDPSHHQYLEFLWVLMLVAVPYGVLFFAVRAGSSVLTVSIAFAVVSVCVAIAAVLYWPSFTTTDPKYVLAIWLAVLSQMAVAAIGLVAVRLLRPKGPRSNMAVVADAPAEAVLDQAAGSARRTPPR
jgi:hypothetical protein